MKTYLIESCEFNFALFTSLRCLHAVADFPFMEFIDFHLLPNNRLYSSIKRGKK